MNPLFLYNLWSFKKELMYVALGFLITISLPIIAVFILVNGGVDVVSNHLATSNPSNNTVTIHDPIDSSNDKVITNKMEWPIHGVVTLEFGESDLPYQPLHTGIDIANPYGKEGDPITPFMVGTVIKAEQLWWGYGKYVEIDHGNHVVSIYGHMSKLFVYQGEPVKLGQVIGLEGQTGWATGPHVHFEIRVFGIPTNPHIFLGKASPPN